jgi:hypothetical protein
MGKKCAVTIPIAGISKRKKLKSTTNAVKHSITFTPERYDHYRPASPQMTAWPILLA